jgi:hypothetical protein
MLLFLDVGVFVFLLRGTMHENFSSRFVQHIFIGELLVAGLAVKT